MSSKIKIRRVAQVDDGGLAGSTAHIDLDGVVTGHLKGHLRHHSAGVTLTEPLRDVTHDNLVAVHVGSPIHLEFQ